MLTSLFFRSDPKKGGTGSAGHDVNIPHNRAIHIQRSSVILILPMKEVAMPKARFTEHLIIAICMKVEQ